MTAEPAVSRAYLLYLLASAYEVKVDTESWIKGMEVTRAMKPEVSFSESDEVVVVLVLFRMVSSSTDEAEVRESKSERSDSEELLLEYWVVIMGDVKY